LHAEIDVASATARRAAGTMRDLTESPRRCLEKSGNGKKLCFRIGRSAVRLERAGEGAPESATSVKFSGALSKP
jgi:hypothetical protein